MNYSRPNGLTRMQNLSAAKAGIPSAEFDAEWNGIVSELNEALPKDGSEPMTGNLTLANSTPSNDLHATSKKYVDDLNIRPAFSVHLNAVNQANVPQATYTQVQFTTEDYDTNNNFNNTGSEVNGIPPWSFKPSVAGKYALTLNIGIVQLEGNARLWVVLYKNNNAYYKTVFVNDALATRPGVPISIQVEADGINDYFSGYVYHDAGSVARDISGNTLYTRFTGSKIA